MSEVRNRWLTIAALSAVGILVADKLVLTALTRHWDDQGVRIADLRDRVDHGRNMLDREEVLRQRWETMQLGAIQDEASAAEDDVLRAAARWARDSRITMTSLVPQWRDEDGYRTLDCRATVQGDLSAVARFLLELEKDPLAIRLERAALTTRNEQGRVLMLDTRFSALQLPIEEEEAI